MRNVTADDYLVRTLSMPSKFGTISKALTQRPNAGGDANTTLNIFVLSIDVNKHLTTASSTLKNNLKSYLNQYRMIGDNIEIRDAFVINIGIDFEIIVLPSFNGKEVLVRAIDRVKKYFDTEKWQFNQPILLNDLAAKLSVVEGVQALVDVKIKNNVSTR